MRADQLGELPISALAAQTIEDARELVKVELELAKQDLREELKAATRSMIELAISFACAVLAVGSLVVSVALATGGAWVAFGFGIAFLVAGGILGAAGYAAFPKHPLEPTRDRLVTDVERLKEHVT